MDSRVKDLIASSDALFTKKQTLNTLCQEIAMNFYPERADFTVTRYVGEEYAKNLTSSYPLLVRRELQGLVSGMLRPTDKEWFETTIFRDDKLDKGGKAWLEWATRLQRRAMYDPDSNLIRATKECDGDFVTFGQGVIQLTWNQRKNALLFRNHHFRDVAWCQNIEEKIDRVDRKWKPTCRDLIQTFSKNPDAKLHSKVTEARDKYSQVNVRHIVIPTEDYEAPGPNKKFRTPFVSVYIDVDNGVIILEEPSVVLQYVIPRWMTISGSQYAFSPCTSAALPEARLLQAIALTLLEAGEKAVNPPMIATQDVIRSDINIHAGGVTWADKDYDERIGAAIRPMDQDFSGLPIGLQMANNSQLLLREAFYLNKINMPPAIDRKEMTAFEVGQMVQEYVRNALPLFEPMEMDYNGGLCAMSFDLLQANGGFGAPQDMPRSLSGQAVSFKFQSPLHEAIDRQKGHTFMEAKAMVAQALDLDPSAATMFDARAALRDCLEGIGVPQKWQRDDREMDQIQAQHAQDEQAAKLLATMNAGATTAEQIGKAGAALQSVQEPVV